MNAIETLRENFRVTRHAARTEHGLDATTFDRALEIAMADLTNDGEAWADSEPSAAERGAAFLAAARMVGRNDGGIVDEARADVALFQEREARREKKVADLIALGLDEKRARALVR